jgi:hypothetical protein
MEGLERILGLPVTKFLCQSFNKKPVSSTPCDSSVVEDGRDYENEHCTQLDGGIWVRLERSTKDNEVEDQEQREEDCRTDHHVFVCGSGYLSCLGVYPTDEVFQFPLSLRSATTDVPVSISGHPGTATYA